MEKTYSYQDAFNELQQLVSEIEAGEVAVDELTSKISRASSLIAICQAKLKASEEEVEKMLKQLESKTEHPEEE